MDEIIYGIIGMPVPEIFSINHVPEFIEIQQHPHRVSGWILHAIYGFAVLSGGAEHKTGRV